MRIDVARDADAMTFLSPLLGGTANCAVLWIGGLRTLEFFNF